MEEKQTIEETKLESFQRYFDVKFSHIESEIKRLYDQEKQKDSEVSRKIESIERDMSELKLKLAAITQDIKSNTEDLKELEEYKRIVNSLNQRIDTIASKIKELTEIIKTRQKNTLAISIAIMSPFLTMGIKALYDITAFWPVMRDISSTADSRIFTF